MNDDRFHRRFICLRDDRADRDSGKNQGRKQKGVLFHNLGKLRLLKLN
jgi:hypothetical protein